MNAAPLSTPTTRPLARSAATAKMRAIVQSGYGDHDTLALREIPRPTPADDEVLVRVHGSSVNFGDWAMMTGRPFPVRFFSGLLRPKAHAFGLDLAGRVISVGRDVTRFQPGDEVYGEIGCAYAEYACAPARLLALKPGNLSFEEAAAVPVAGLTALQGLRGRVKPGQRVLINGASGGVGTFAVQVARALGAEVTGVCRTDSVEMVKSIGAHRVIDYTRDDFTRGDERYDVIFDLAGSASIRACHRVMTPTGTYISSVGRTGWLLKSLAALLTPGLRVSLLAAQSNADDLAALTALIEAGEVTPVIHRRFTLDEAPEALRRFGEGHARGKTVISV